MVPSEVYLTQISRTRSSLVVRDSNKDDHDEFLQLRDSISRNGLIEPIVIRPVNDRGSYEIVAGNRRYEAVQQLEWKKIPAVIQDVTDVKLRRLAFIENVYREDLSDSEKAHSIAAIYQDIGFQPEKAIQIVKRIHNKGESYEVTKSERLNTKQDLLRPTSAFLDAFKDIGIPANSQYQLLQLIVQLDDEVLNEAENEGMPLAAKVMLAHPTLRKKGKKTQKKIIKDVKGLRGRKARQRIKQHIDAAKDDKELDDSPTDSVKKDLMERALDINALVEKLIAKIINRPLSRGQIFFTKEIIDNQKEEIFALITGLGDTREFESFDEQMELLRYTVNLVERNINKVREQNERKRELNRP